MVDKEILIATVNGNYCAIGNSDRSADFLEIPIKEKGFVKVIEVYFLVFTLGFIVELTLLLPPIVTREYAVAVGFTLAATVAFGVETYRNWRRL